MLQGTRIIEPAKGAYSYPLLIKRLLDTPLMNSPRQEIVYRDTKKFTYAEFAGRAKRLASGLKAMGVGAGDIVAFLDWDSYRYLEAYFAVPGMGAVLHTVNARLSPDQVLFTMNHAQDMVVFVHQDFLPMMVPLRDKLHTVKKWILIKEPGQPEPPAGMGFDYEYEQVLEMGTSDFEFPDMDENSQATLSYTTGTTGDPKGVYFSHRQLVLHTLGAACGLGCQDPLGRFSSRDVYMPLTPMFHVHAWGLPYLATLLGVKQVYPGRYEPPMILKLKQEHKVSFSHCVPTILQLLFACPDVKNVDLSGWKMVIGGSAFTKGLCKQVLEAGIDVYSGYGMSETCPILTLANFKAGDLASKDEEFNLGVRTSTGLSIPMVDLKVMDPNLNQQPLDGDTAGEICVRAPWCTQGYFENPQRGEDLWEGGYLHTGDLAVRDSEGYVRITDRLKDVIKTGGEWISSLTLESLISQHPHVSEVAVVGIPDEKWGERPLAMVVPRKGSLAEPEEIKAFLQKFVDDGTIKKWALPERIMISNSLPKTSVGKLNKRVIRAKFMAE